LTPTPALDALRVSRVLPASPERVFRAWTTPVDVKRWFGRPDGFDVPNVEMDVRVGGRYRIELAGPDVGAAIVGTYREVSPSVRLSFTFSWETPLLDVMDIGETLVTVRFTDVEGRTEVTLVHERLRSDATVSFHSFGWTSGFDRLEEFLGSEVAEG
jgi:uncharacterized protein YndB with AHSA1/START domain